MTETDRAPVPQQCFEEAVLAVVGAILKTDRRIDLVVNDHLAEGPLFREDGDLRADLIICAAECLRLVTALPGGRLGIARDFPAFATACRTIPGSKIGEPGATRIQRALRNIATGLLVFRRI